MEKYALLIGCIPPDPLKFYLILTISVRAHAEAMKDMNGITHIKLSALMSPWFMPIDSSKDDLTDIPHSSRYVMRPIT
jgi:hypothetical protein